MKWPSTVYIVYFTFSTIDKVYASAWLIDEGNYRYISAIGSADKNSRQLQQVKANLYIETYRKLQYLQEQIKLVSKSSALYNKLSQQIKYLNKEAKNLSNYQESAFQTFIVEYGVSKNLNLGLQIFYKNGNLNHSNNIKNFTANQEISLFYKINLYKKKNRILSIQPRIYIVHNSRSQSEWLYELSLMAGMTKKIYNTLIFVENAFGFAHGANRACKSKHSYSATTTEGVKFPNGIMLTNYSKYSFRFGYDNIYSKTLYSQLSIAKNIKFGGTQYSSLTSQIGYFWDYSLVNRNYKISGLIFSVWIDI